MSRFAIDGAWLGFTFQPHLIATIEDRWIVLRLLAGNGVSWALRFGRRCALVARLWIDLVE